MTVHHTKSSQSDFNVLHCMYCSGTLKPQDWSSEFEFSYHYKVAHCACGKKHRIRLDVNKQWSQLEKRIARHSRELPLKELKWKFSDITGSGSRH